MDKIIWLNFEKYSGLELGLFFSGALLWIIGYIYIIKSIRQKQFVEMPATILAGNFAWEFLWAFVFHQDMGFAIELGYKLWFILDLYIVFSFYKYGFKQVNESVKPYYKTFFTLGLITWWITLYFFIKQGYDNPIGANSAYILNILISSLYVFLFLRMEDKSVFSFTVAWTKGLGTGLISVMCILKWPENYWLISMGIICFIIDVFYFYLFLKNRKIA